MRIRFITSTPLDIRRGSGTYAGIHALAGALQKLGHAVIYETPHRHFFNYTFERLAFNFSLRSASEFDLSVGFDMDGYRIASGTPHVASLKGVIADEVRFEAGFTRLTMSIQARCERLHVNRAARVLTTSRYSGERAMEFYGLHEMPAIVPELIDLTEWRRILAAHPAQPSGCTLLFVGRFYHRKRVPVLLRAAALLRQRLPELRLRIVGNGPCNASWRKLAQELQLDGVVTWLGDVSRTQLAEEYNRAAAFCLPSVQEGFGIVLLEAMAAGKPIVASRAAAIPEAAPHAVLVDPDNVEALAAGIELVFHSPPAPPDWVEQFDAPLIAQRFLDAVSGLN